METGKKCGGYVHLSMSIKKVVRDKVRGQGCSVCAKALKTSFPEQAIFYYMASGN